ncbi:MAG: sulfatase-like hydrolase/transferase [Ruminococcus sp.]|nr:sulfatase-like hydrolase/transferase [Ruminococcus sp.]
MNEATTPTRKKTFKERIELNRQKVLRSILAGFSAPFILILCTGFSLFFTNASELPFAFGDFALVWTLITFILGAVLSALLILTGKMLHKILFTIISFASVAGFFQYMATTLTFKGLPADHGSTAMASTTLKVINLVVWILAATAFIWLGIFFRNTARSRKIITFLLILVTVMQTFATVPNALIYFSDKNKKDPDQGMSFLTHDNMFEVSSQDNIIVFVLDRMDSEYFERFLKNYPEYKEKLDGFTYYSDNISTYPRTYPAITSMLSGINTDFTGRQSYFENAYKDSDFLNDLQKNGYKINLYTPGHYAYEDADVFGDLVSNVAHSVSHTVSDPASLHLGMLELSSYFWAPEIFKSTTISAKSFSDVISYRTDQARYEITETSDAEIYAYLRTEGLNTQDSNKTFSFIHLRGCHAPATLNENCELRLDGSSYDYADAIHQTAGIFRLITEYTDHLKDKGLYDDATIIITGDHGALEHDQNDYTSPICTALLVKEKGEFGTDMKESTAQVSQANLHATIIKSAEIQTSVDYGDAYSEIPEGVNTTRIHYFQPWSTKSENVTYEITGPAKDFNNWKIVSREDIGDLYK